MVGKRFGRLEVIRLYEKTQNGNRWLCKCDCGNQAIVYDRNLRAGTRSCGCLHKELARESHTTHGKANTRLFRIWVGMRHRCRNEKLREYKYYGGKGVSVCNEWNNSFEKFEEWAILHGYNELLTLDRIDVNGNYEPNNCRWVTNEEQQANKSNTMFLTYNGKTLRAKEWEAITGIPYQTIMQRLRYGWSVERIFTTPIRHYRRATS